MKFYVLTVSDSSFNGVREDLSGPEIEKILTEAGYELADRAILPDERELLAKKMQEISDNDKADLLLTTGGTGFSPRDITPEATSDVIERAVPGIPEAMRYYSLQITPQAMLSRATAGIRKGTLIINLPGNPKAVKECLTSILPALDHGLKILKGVANNCARK
ncbi:MogA/MoaB family molybdenum cofactor biosynthesis protein [bacterium]|nr:MogA/MoaB family molybdenum cofactor biosynthesis protein [bacterium]